LIAMTSTRIPSTAAVLAVAALGLAACSTSNHEGPVAALTPGSQYSLKVETGADRIALAPHTGGLSDAQIGALHALAARHADTAGGVVTLSLPHGAADAAVTARSADAAQSTLTVSGVPVQRSTYESDDPKAPLLVSFDYEKAVVPHCGHWDDLTATGDNGSYVNFGCAVNANMAAQVARPSDIARPRAEDPPDSERRTTVLDKYRQGKVTSADEPESKTAGAIARNVGQ
jgi:pilus assembly protein CpaD